MEIDVEKAARELFAGNRSEVVRLLQNRASSAQELWLLAASVEDDDMRFKLLKQVNRSGELPYATLASEILAREAEFDAQMNEAPGWQQWFLTHRNNLMRLIITIVIAAGTVIVGTLLVIPQPLTSAVVALTLAPTQTQAALNATRTMLALTPTVTPTVAPLPVSQQATADYLPVGRLTILYVESNAQTNRKVVHSSNRAIPVAPSAGAAFVAIQYQFVCGTALGTCRKPPQAKLSLKIDNPDTIVPYEDLTLMDIPAPGLGATATGPAQLEGVSPGGTTTGWLVFQVSANAVPRAIRIEPDRTTITSEGPTPTPIDLTLPR